MDGEALRAFAHLGVFIQLQDLPRSYMTRKFETIPYYYAQKNGVLIWIYFHKGEQRPLGSMTPITK